MDVERLRDSPAGTLVPISGFDPCVGKDYEHFAFIPNPLPTSTIDLTPETWLVVTEAATALGQLDQAGVLVPNSSLIRRPLLRREAVSTSALEGTHAAFAEVLEADVVEQEPRTPELREVLNYVAAAELAIASVLEGRSISKGLLGDVHQRLFRGIGTDRKDAGRVRTSQVVIGPEQCAVTEARFVPVPGDDRLHAGLDAWLTWIHTTHPLPVVVQAALAHYQFESLHPFDDGNGRIGRLMVLLQLLQTGELHEPLIEVSPWFERRRRDYQDHLLKVSLTGDWDPWVNFFARAIKAQAASATRTINDLLQLQGETRETVRAQGVRGVAVDIAEGLIGHPTITPTWVARAYDVSYPTANAALGKLEALGVVREVTGGNYGRRFTSDAVVAILNRA